MRGIRKIPALPTHDGGPESIYREIYSNYLSRMYFKTFSTVWT